MYHLTLTYTLTVSQILWYIYELTVYHINVIYKVPRFALLLYTHSVPNCNIKSPLIFMLQLWTFSVGLNCNISIPFRFILLLCTYIVASNYNINSPQWFSLQLWTNSVAFNCNIYNPRRLISLVWTYSVASKCTTYSPEKCILLLWAYLVTSICNIYSRIYVLCPQHLATICSTASHDDGPVTTCFSFIFFRFTENR